MTCVEAALNQDTAPSSSAFLPPKEIVLSQEPPVPARQRSSYLISRLQEIQNQQRQLFGEEGDKDPLELRLEELHHVSHSAQLTLLYQHVYGQNPFSL